MALEFLFKEDEEYEYDITSYLGSDNKPRIRARIRNTDTTGKLVKLYWRKEGETEAQVFYTNRTGSFYCVIPDFPGYDTSGQGPNEDGTWPDLSFGRLYYLNLSYDQEPVVYPEGTGPSVVTITSSKPSLEIVSIGSTNVTIQITEADERIRWIWADVRPLNSSTRVYSGMDDCVYYPTTHIFTVPAGRLTPDTQYRVYGQWWKWDHEETEPSYGNSTDPAYIIFRTKKSGAHIYTTEWKNASVWIYCTVNGVTDWHKATPYIYTSNGWKQTI